MDLIETVRPDVERLVLGIVGSRVFRRIDFAESPDGGVRVLAPLSHELGATLPDWALLLRPWAERVAAVIAASTGTVRPSTRLTGTQRRRIHQQLAASRSVLVSTRAQRTVVKKRCEGCGKPLARNKLTWCPSCWPAQRRDAGLDGSTVSAESLTDPVTYAARGQSVSHGKRAAKAARLETLGFCLADWEVIAPQLEAISTAAIAEALGVSLPTAYRFRHNQVVPASRHWPGLAGLVAPVIRHSDINQAYPHHRISDQPL